MKILMAHNYYQQPGGEDNSFASEVALLRRHGHEVHTCIRHNDELNNTSPLRRAQITLWHREVYGNFRRLIRTLRPDIVHLHNTFNVISPAAYHAVKSEGVATVQTLHNYRLLCPNALLFRNDLVCEDCMGRFFSWPGIRRGCYRSSKAATGAVSIMNSFHRVIGTWKSMVDIYIALTGFSRLKFIQAGFPGEKVVVKPNFIERFSGSPDLAKRPVGEGALFVGRLSSEKGIKTLLEAWGTVGQSVPLTIVGEGPLAPVVQEAASGVNHITWVGRQPLHEVYALMVRARVLILPSIWYETFGRVAVESFAQGTPVIASRLGAMAEIVEDGFTGLHFEPGNARDLADKVQWAHEHANEMAHMGRNARTVYEAEYTPEKNYPILLAIYEKAIKNKNLRSNP